MGRDRTSSNPGSLLSARVALALLLPTLAAAPAGAQEATAPETLAKPATHPATQVILDALGSVSIGVAWQATEFDITPDADLLAALAEAARRFMAYLSVDTVRCTDGVEPSVRAILENL